jgi:hypothetical protein
MIDIEDLGLTVPRSNATLRVILVQVISSDKRSNGIQKKHEAYNEETVQTSTC